MKNILLLLLFLPFTLPSQSLDSLLDKLNRQSLADTNRVNTLNDIAYHQWINGDDALAKQNCFEAIELAKKINFPTGESNARFQIVRIEMDLLEDVKSAYAHLDTADMIAKKSKDDLILGISKFRRAQLVSSAASDSNQAPDSLLNVALAIFQTIGAKSWEGSVYNEKSTLASYEGNYALSIDLLLKARTIQESLHDEKRLRSTLPNLGVTYVQVEMYPEALECFKQAEKIAKKNNDVRILAFLHNQKGDIFKKQARFSEAFDSYQAAAEIYKTTNTAQSLPSAYARLSDICFRMARFDASLRYNQQADSIFRATNSEGAIYHYVQLNYGNLYLQKKDYPHAISVAKKGLNYIETPGSLAIEESTYHRQLSEAYEKTGNYPQAFYHLSRFKTTSDSLNSDQSKQKIRAATMTYEIDKMKSERDVALQESENRRLLQSRNYLISALLAGILALIYFLWVNRRLKKYNAQLIHKNREIEMALDRGQKIERRRVASELHDNLNTKLAALRWSLESMNTDKWEASDKTLHHKILSMATDAYKDVRLISHNMLPSELEAEGLVSAFKLLTRKLNELGDIRFRLSDSGIARRFSKNEEHQLYNIALEAINNVLKHANATEVTLDLIILKDALKLMISDNGKGIDHANAKDGMGIRNISNRAESIGGTVNIDSEAGKGTTLTITMPLG